jgi:LacI family transcriptional regulator
VTIVDVARHAGVSTTAVSKVVRNASGTSAQMRSRGRHGPAAGYDVVADDDFTGAGLVVAHLAGLGHRRIAHIEHHETDPVRLAEMPNARRADGYRHAMRAHGLGDRIDIVSTTYNREGGYLGTRRLL